MRVGIGIGERAQQEPFGGDGKDQAAHGLNASQPVGAMRRDQPECAGPRSTSVAGRLPWEQRTDPP